MNRLEPRDEAILVGIAQGQTIEQICKVVLTTKAYVHGRIVELEEADLVSPPPVKYRSGRKITERGKRYLIACGYLKET